MSALVDPRTDPAWAALVDRSPGATIFHHPAWATLLAAQYGYRFEAVVVREGDDVVAGLPVAVVASRLTGRRLVSLPFSDACPPLLAPGAGTDAAAALTQAVAAEQARRGLPLEVRAGVPGLGRAATRHLQHVVDLSGGAEAARAAYASAVRRNVRKARREGVTVGLHRDREALDAFFALLVETRRRLGAPTQPRSFVRALGGLYDQGLGFTAVARHDGRPVAAAVFLRTGTTLTYKYGASDLAVQHLRANNLLFDHVIGAACDDGARALDLGRTDLGQDGLAAFKRSWGAAEAPLAYTYAGREPPSPGPSRAERAVAGVIRRSPPAVGAAIGAMLYRHVG